MKKLLCACIALSLILILSASALAEDTVVVGDLYRPGQTEEQFEETARTANTTRTGAGNRQIKYFDSFTSMLLALQSGRIGEIMSVLPTAEYVVARNPEMAVRQSEGDAPTVLLSMAVNKENKDLRDQLNTALAALVADGAIDALYATYTADPTVDPEPKAIPTIEGAATMRVVVTGDLPPLDYTTTDGQPAGFNVALLAALGEKVNLNIELIMTDAGSRAAMLNSGRADAIFWMRSFSIPTPSGTPFVVSEVSDGLTLTEPYLSMPTAEILMQ